jgi:GTP-binding protein HflX
VSASPAGPAEPAPAVGPAAFVIHPDAGKGRSRPADTESRLDEAVGLARAINLDIRDAFVVRLKRINPASYLGRGITEDVGRRVADETIGLVVMDCALSPGQQRNLERRWSCKVIDRTALILEIFGARARTKEGRLQVELAHLTYQRSRLVRSWTHLERQRGGYGFLGGPGESQIEIDRRLIDQRLARLRGELEAVGKRRAIQRKARIKVPYPVIALVGYTNAGKSTLFNRLTGARVFAENLLFATLDPTMRALALPSGQSAVLSDTVGFISDLPTQLVAAFRATLEEVVGADIILHVRDIARADSDAQAHSVHQVLRELGLAEQVDHGLFEAWNKIDLLDRDAVAALRERAKRANATIVLVSAATGAGCDRLVAALDQALSRRRRTVQLSVAHRHGEVISWLYDHGHVLDRIDDTDRTHMTVDLAPEDLSRFEALCARLKIDPHASMS